MERTLLIIKPDAISHASDILDRLRNAGFKISQIRTVRLTEEQATDFFQEEISEPNFPAIVAFMTSAPIMAVFIQKLNLFEEIQSFVGPKNPITGRSLNPNCLRAIYGKDEIHNSIHYSEDVLTARREIHFFFQDAIIDPIPSMENAKLFVESAIYPTLLRGLTELCKEKPANPTAWLGHWLHTNNPHKPKIQE